MGKLLLGLLAAGKLGKVALTGGTMLLSVIAYAFVFGWWYAVGFVLLIFVHEMGHYIAAKQRGLNVGAPTFIPFVGAWIQLKDQPHNAETEAYVGLAGPLVGTHRRAGVLFRRAQHRQQPALGALLRGLLHQPFQPDPTLTLRRRAHHGSPIAARLAAGRADPDRPLLLSPESHAHPGRPDGGTAGHARVEVRPQGPGKRRLLHDQP